MTKILTNQYIERYQLVSEQNLYLVFIKHKGSVTLVTLRVIISNYFWVNYMRTVTICEENLFEMILEISNLNATRRKMYIQVSNKHLINSALISTYWTVISEYLASLSLSSKHPKPRYEKHPQTWTFTGCFLLAL